MQRFSTAILNGLCVVSLSSGGNLIDTTLEGNVRAKVNAALQNLVPVVVTGFTVAQAKIYVTKANETREEKLTIKLTIKILKRFVELIHFC